MFQENEKKKRIFNLKKTLYTAMLMSLTLVISTLTFSQKIYAEEKTDDPSAGSSTHTPLRPLDQTHRNVSSNARTSRPP